MKFSLWTHHGALNSKPVFDAFKHSLIQAGHTVYENHPGADVDVIWSVLWSGRMSKNKLIWNAACSNNKPVIVLEVGGIQRGTTWKVGLNGINKGAFFSTGNDNSRAKLLGLNLKPWRTTGEHILICGQHERSLQWQNMPDMTQWIKNTIVEIRKFSDRKIIVRPHPRCAIQTVENYFNNVSRQIPTKQQGTYDDYGMSFNDAHAVINWSSNPGIHSVINGVPAFVGPSSLAHDVANHSLDTIENPSTPDREQWLNDYAHTEWNIQEISSGIPLKYLTERL
jgi:hypothetical protein